MEYDGGVVGGRGLSHSALLHFAQYFSCGLGTGRFPKSVFSRDTSSGTSRLSTSARRYSMSPRTAGYATAFCPFGSLPPCSIHWIVNLRADFQYGDGTSGVAADGAPGAGSCCSLELGTG